jgi:hypothetical protein
MWPPIRGGTARRDLSSREELDRPALGSGRSPSARAIYFEAGKVLVTSPVLLTTRSAARTLLLDVVK